MAREYTEAQLILIKKIGLEAFLKSLDADYKKVSEGRKSKLSADAVTRKALTRGKGIFSATGEGRLADVAEVAEDDVPSAVKTKLNGKGIELDLRAEVYTVGDTYYVSSSARETAMRSMEKQGIRINTFDNKHPKFYASGSHLTDGGGPRIQGPAGGVGSCKFIIIQRA